MVQAGKHLISFRIGGNLIMCNSFIFAIVSFALGCFTGGRITTLFLSIIVFFCTRSLSISNYNLIQVSHSSCCLSVIFFQGADIYSQHRCYGLSKTLKVTTMFFFINKLPLKHRVFRQTHIFCLI